MPLSFHQQCKRFHLSTKADRLTLKPLAISPLPKRVFRATVYFRVLLASLLVLGQLRWEWKYDRPQRVFVG